MANKCVDVWYRLEAETGYGQHLVKLCVTGSLISTILRRAQEQCDKCDVMRTD